MKESLEYSNDQIAQRKTQQEVAGSQESITITDDRPSTVYQRRLKNDIEESKANTNSSIQRKPNRTGLPDQLKSGIENLSGYAMDDVKVHYNSTRPAQLNALAYAQGTNIHLGPGQEKHLPHEAWHVVQQKQGRVKPTMQFQGKIAVNEDAGLEKEADVMGKRAANSNIVVDSAINQMIIEDFKNDSMPLQRYQKTDDEVIQLYTNYTGVANPNTQQFVAALTLAVPVDRFSGHDLSGVNMQAVQPALLQGITYHRCTFNNRNFANLNIRTSEFYSCDLNQCDFRSTDLSFVTFSDSEFDDQVLFNLQTNFDNARFDTDSLAFILWFGRGNNMNVQNRPNLSLNNIWLNGTRFRHQTLLFPNHAGMLDIFPHASLPGLNMSFFQMPNVNFAHANLQNAHLQGNDLTGANLRRAVLSGADLRGTNLTGANLHRADLTGADLRRTTLTTANLSNANLSGADLRWANLRGADLDNADLSGADLRGAIMNNVIYRNTVLTGANLSWQVITQGLLDNSVLGGISFINSDFRGLQIDAIGPFVNDNLTRANFSNCRIINVNFSSSQLIRGIFDNAELYRVNFQNADLTNVTFNNAMFHTVRPAAVGEEPRARLRRARPKLNTRHFTGAILTNADFRQASLMSGARVLALDTAAITFLRGRNALA